MSDFTSLFFNVIFEELGRVLCHSVGCGVFSLCDWLLQGADHWDEVYAVLERDTLSLFQDQEAAAQVEFIHVDIHLQDGIVLTASELVKLLKLC